MTNIFKTLITGSAFIALSGTAFADEPTSTTFAYDASAPVQVTYERFREIAEEACEISMLDAGGLVAKTRIEKKCRDEMVDEAVKATHISVLIAYHKQQIEADAEEAKLASLRQDNSTN